MLAAVSAADLGAHTVPVTRGAFGGMASNDGPIPVRALSQAAWLIRDARQLGQYGKPIAFARLAGHRDAHTRDRMREAVEHLARAG
jgi:pyruvate/2-oxoglutarate dehydrogenase complex dihydrolipoamide dehydrogenase (E3) component